MSDLYDNILNDYLRPVNSGTVLEAVADTAMDDVWPIRVWAAYTILWRAGISEIETNELHRIMGKALAECLDKHIKYHVQNDYESASIEGKR